MTIKALPEKIEVFCEGKCIADHPRCFGRHESIYRLEHYLPILERKSRAIFQASPVRDNVPEYFLAWLERQELMSKELVALLERSLEIGFDAVMHGEAAIAPPPVPDAADPIPVQATDLSAYDDRFFGHREEANP